MVDLSGITLALLLTPAGVAAAAAIVFAVVEILKANFPALDARVSGALQATVITAGLYALAFIGSVDHSLNAAFSAFLLWVMAAGLAIGIHGAISHIQTVTRAP